MQKYVAFNSYTTIMLRISALQS